MKKILILFGSVVIIAVIVVILLISNGKDSVDSGLKQLKEDKYEDAVTSFEEALDKDENNIEAKLGLASAHKSLNEIDEATEILLEILDEDNKNIEAYVLLFDIYTENDQKDKALETIKSAYELTDSKKLKTMILELEPYEVPTVNLEEGLYKLGVVLEFKANDELEILYSLDGGTPSIKYIDPIELEVGYYTVTFLAVDKEGYQSKTMFYSYTIEDSLEVGNTSGNLFSGGYILESDSTLYVSMDGQIVKYENDMEGIVILENAYAFNLNSYGSWLYYQTTEGIFKAKNDGSDQQFVVEAFEISLIQNSVLVMQIFGDDLYFINPEGYLTKRNLISNESQVISDILFAKQYGGQDGPVETSCIPFYIKDDSIYYIYDMLNQDPSQSVSLYKMDLNGLNNEEIVSNVNRFSYGYVTFVFDETYLYYVSYDDATSGYYLNKYHLDDEVLIMTERVGDYVSGKVNSVGSLNVQDEVVYYTKNTFIDSESEGPLYTGQLHKMDTRTKEVTLLNENDMNYTWGYEFVPFPVSIAGDTLYYYENNKRVRQDIKYVDLMTPGWGN